MKSIYKILFTICILSLVLTEVFSHKRIKSKKRFHATKENKAGDENNKEEADPAKKNYLILKTQKAFQMDEVPEQLKDDKLQSEEVAKREETLSKFAINKTFLLFGSEQKAIDECQAKLSDELRSAIMSIFHNRAKLTTKDKLYLDSRKRYPVECKDLLENMWNNLSKDQFQWKGMVNHYFYNARRLRKLRKLLEKKIKDAENKHAGTLIAKDK